MLDLLLHKFLNNYSDEDLMTNAGSHQRKADIRHASIALLLPRACLRFYLGFLLTVADVQVE